MANKVFANGREISCKAAAGKSVACTPDVCLSPPSPPAGPVPIPYPNTGFASDATNGSRTVSISGKEVMKKNKSYFKKSTGDEAATRSLGMGVVTHTITGKVYFVGWSPDVKVEGQNAVRHFDQTTHNHSSDPGNTPPWPYADSMDPAKDPCAKDKEKEKDACEGEGKVQCPTDPAEYKTNECVKARRCKLTRYDAKKGGPDACCEPQTGHHLMPKHHFKGMTGYDENAAPCVCLEGWSWHRGDHSAFDNADKTHPQFHDVQDYLEQEAIAELGKNKMKYDLVKQNAMATHQSMFPDSGCNPACIEKQLDSYHKDTAKVPADADLKTHKRSKNKILKVEGAQARINAAKDAMSNGTTVSADF